MPPKDLNGLPPFFLTVSITEKIKQKFDPPLAERNEPTIFIFCLAPSKALLGNIVRKGHPKIGKESHAINLQIP